MHDSRIADSVQSWVESFVVEMNLCPFAKRELVQGRVRFKVSDAKTEEHLLLALQEELELLENDESIETTLLIHPDVLRDFYAYNQFLNSVDKLIVDSGFEGIYQIASFHPDYQFEGTNADDAENYTNRSPHPILHLLREESLELAIEMHPSAEKIPIRNIALMNSLGASKLRLLLKGCMR